MISVIIPVYNEKESIQRIIHTVKKIIKAEILIIDDGSEEDLLFLREEKDIGVIRHPYNMGNGASVKTGIRNAKGEILVLMDGDGQHNPQDIPKLLKYIGQYDMVVGARTKDSEINLARKLANRIYNLFSSYVAGFRIEDLTSGFRVVKKDIAMKFLYLLPNRFSYPVTITLAFLKAGRSIKYVPVKTFARKGKSKLRPLKDGIRFFLIILKIATLFSPLRIFLPVSVFFFFLGVGYYLYTFISYHRFTNMSALLFTTSVILFMLGLISEQISQLRFERTEDSR